MSSHEHSAQFIWNPSMPGIHRSVIKKQGLRAPIASRARETTDGGVELHRPIPAGAVRLVQGPGIGLIFRQEHAEPAVDLRRLMRLALKAAGH